MTSRTVTAVLKAEASQYLQGMRQAEAAAKATGNATKSAGTAAAAGTKQMGTAAQGAASANQKMGQSAQQAADATGKLGASTGAAAAGASKVGAAASAAGSSLKGAVGDVDKFGQSLTQADVNMGRYVDSAGYVRTANGDFIAGFRGAAQATDQAAASADEAASGWQKLSQTAMQNEHAWSTVSTTLLGVGAAAVAGVGLAVKTYADYDKAMSSVQAATHASEADMAALGDAAIKAGADTAFSAEEAARGIEELAKAGVSTQDILGGGLDGALSLAAAGSLEVGDAAEIAASALTQFKLEGSDVGHIADLLAAGAGKAQGSVHDLGMALNQVGLVASGTGLSIEETVGGLAAFASAGLIGSDAGTSFKTMLQRLTPQSEEAAKLMDQLGLSAYDSQGEFIGLSEYAGRLQTALSGMSAEQRNATMNTLFGSDAVRAANVLYEQGSAGVEKWESAVNDAGYAAETAALMQDNLTGDLEKLGGAMDTVFLKAGSGPNDFLRNVVQGAESAVDAVGRVPAPVLATGAAIVGIAGSGALLAGGLMKGISAVAETKAALDTLGVSVDGAKGKLATLGKVAGVAGGIAILAKSLIEVADASAPTAAGLSEIENALAGTPGKLDAVNAAFANAEWANGNQGGLAGRMHSTVEGIDGIGDALTKLQNLSFNDSFSAWGNELIGMEDPLNTMRDQLESVDQALANMAQSGNAEGAAAQFRSIMDSVKASGGDVQEAAASFDTYRAAVQDYATSLGVTLDDQQVFSAMMGDMPPVLSEAAGGADAAAEGIAGIGAEAAEAAPSLSDIVDSLSALGLTAVDSRSAMASYQEALATMAETAATTGGALNAMGTDFDLTTESGRAMSEAMGAVAAEAWDNAEGMTALGRSAGDVAGAMQGTYDSLVATATGLGMSDENARSLAASLLGIPPGVNVETWMSDQAKAMAGETKGAVDAIPTSKGVTVTATDGGSVGTVQAAVNGLQGKTINAVVTDQGTVTLTQGQINAIYGKTTQVTVTDNGTVYHTQGAINGVTDGDATIYVDENGVATVQSGINMVQGKTVYIDVIQRYSSIGEHVSQSKGALRPGLMAGGRVPGLRTGGVAGLGSIKGAWSGYRLPTTGPGTGIRDGFLGVSGATGMPTVRVDGGEWVINRGSSDRYNALLSMVNRDDPRVRNLAGHAAGGRAGSREYAAAPAGAYAGRATVEVDTSGVAAEVSRAMSAWQPVVELGDRQFFGVMRRAEQQMNRR